MNASSQGCCSNSHFSQDLLGRIRPQTGHFRLPLHRFLIRAEQHSHLLFHLRLLSLDHFQFFQNHLQQTTINPVQFCRGLQCIAQLFAGRAQMSIRESAKAAGSQYPSAKPRKIRHPLTPSRSETRLDNLI